MPSYYFHLASDRGLIEADEPSDLPDIKAAKTEAMVAARDLASQAVARGEDGPWRAVVVLDERGNRVCEVPLEEALPPRFQCED
jgi:hypothetical protein